MEQTAKQQIVERVKQASNILVTVSTNPSVDQLAACIGLTLMLTKMDKHGTAVFSGQIPSTIEFLQPEKTIESNTDSLRDFIISLDKSKADKLRYKVEDEVVRIFITPYRTSISEKDLVFSQGDFNVEVVIALGVKSREQVDSAIATHGRILHDATVICVNAGDAAAADVGQINWNEPTASSLSEMIVSISEAFGSGLIDNQMATAFLTGIVAETERFSNTKTSPKVMTMSAQLMAAGANQQLIASKLQVTGPVKVEEATVSIQPSKDGQDANMESNPGQLEISHEDKEPKKDEREDSRAQKPKKEKSADDSKRNQNPTKQPERLFEPPSDNVKKADETEKTDEQQSREFLDPSGEPTTGGTLTANSKPEQYSGSSDPLSQLVSRPDGDEPKNEVPIFSHDNTNPLDILAPAPEETSQEPTDPVATPMSLPEPKPELEDETLSQIEEEIKAEAASQPVADVPLPEIPQLPSEVPQPEAPAWQLPVPAAVTDSSDLEAARNLVINATAASPFDPGAEGPVASHNALPLGDEIHQDIPTPTTAEASTEPISDGTTLSIPGLSYEPTPLQDEKSEEKEDKIDDPAPPIVPPPILPIT